MRDLVGVRLSLEVAVEDGDEGVVNVVGLEAGEGASINKGDSGQVRV